MPERPRAVICHVTSGRLRLRIPERRRDEAFFAHLEERLSAWPGVEHVGVDAITAGVVVRFADGPAFAARIRETDIFELEERDPAAAVSTPSVLEETRQGLKRVDARLRELTGGAGDIASLVFFALLAGGVYQLARGNIAAPAVTLLWYAAEVLKLWREEPEAGTPAVDDVRFP